jgi:hypothetical protein
MMVTIQVLLIGDWVVVMMILDIELIFTLVDILAILVWYLTIEYHHYL